MPRILLVSSTVLGTGMHTVLQRSPGNEILLLRGTMSEYVAHQVKTFRPDLSILDETSFPVLPWLKQLGKERARELGPIVVTMQELPTEEALFQLLMWGCFACLTARASAESLLATVQKVGQGECLLTEMSAKTPPTPPPPPQSLLPGSTNPLTSREVEVLELVARGNTNKQIGRGLKLSDQTVKNHMTAILHKLGRKDRTSAVTYALAHQWICVPGFPQPEQRSASVAA